jgi:hypothetical protein
MPVVHLPFHLPKSLRRIGDNGYGSVTSAPETLTSSISLNSTIPFSPIQKILNEIWLILKECVDVSATVESKAFRPQVPMTYLEVATLKQPVD